MIDFNICKKCLTEFFNKRQEEKEEKRKKDQEKMQALVASNQPNQPVYVLTMPSNYTTPVVSTNSCSTNVLVTNTSGSYYMTKEELCQIISDDSGLNDLSKSLICSCLFIEKLNKIEEINRKYNLPKYIGHLNLIPTILKEGCNCLKCGMNSVFEMEHCKYLTEQILINQGMHEQKSPANT